MSPDTWDAIVIGAGPAGSMAACHLARAGARVLLVERKAFPRPKVCGGCLNAHALAALDRAGVGDLVRALGARPITAVTLRHGSRAATIPLPAGLAVTRDALDAALAGAAVRSGAVFAPETTALVQEEGVSAAHEGWRQVTLQPRHGTTTTVRGRIVLAADGLSHGSLRDCASMRSLLAPHARVGLGSLVPAGAVETSAGTITMAVGRHGYVGAVQVERGRINVAAALDPGFLKAHAHASGAVASILSGAGVRFDRRLESSEWSGTIPLTRRLPVPAARRLFVLGDAAGYVEPFTGEGMAWAFAAAESVAPLALRAIAGWNDGLAGAWIEAYGRSVGREQHWCRAVARVLRVPALVAPLVTLLQYRPGLAEPVLAHLRPRAT